MSLQFLCLIWTEKCGSERVKNLWCKFVDLRSKAQQKLSFSTFRVQWLEWTAEMETLNLRLMEVSLAFDQKPTWAPWRHHKCQVPLHPTSARDTHYPVQNTIRSSCMRVVLSYGVKSLSLNKWQLQQLQGRGLHFCHLTKKPCTSPLICQHFKWTTLIIITLGTTLHRVRLGCYTLNTKPRYKRTSARRSSPSVVN